MKTIVKIVLALLCVIPCHSFAQRSWGNWVQLWSHEGRSCSVSFNVMPNCKNFSYSFYRTDNSIVYEKGHIYYSFDYINCDGRQSTEHATILLNKSGIDDDKGQWFLANGGRITNIIVNEIFIPEREIWLKRSGGITVDFWKQRYGKQLQKETLKTENNQKTEPEKTLQLQHQAQTELVQPKVISEINTKFEK